MARSPLHEVHEAHGARFTDFGGWEMPVQYEGVLAEHAAVRTGVGVFDVTHLGRFDLRGPGSVAALGRLLCNDITAIEPGRAQYTMALNEAGGVEDDIIVWRWSEAHAWVLPNGVNLEKIEDLFRQEPDVEVQPLRDETVMLAVQGPGAPAVIEGVLGVAPGRFRVAALEFEGRPVWAAGTGYTGERGGELCIAAEHAPGLWSALVAAGATPCGLGARDTLRLEMGYPLWGQDLNPDTTPLEAGLGWVVDWSHEFRGRAALERQQAEGLSKQLLAFHTGGRQIPRPGYPLRMGGSRGRVASGNFGPGLGVGIGLGYLAPVPEADAVLEMEIRGRWQPLTIVDTPFIGA